MGAPAIVVATPVVIVRRLLVARLVGAFFLPLCMAGAIALPLFLLGVRGTAFSIGVDAGLLAGSLGLIVPWYDLRSCGLRWPRASALAWPAAFVGLRTATWLLMVPITELRHDGALLLASLLYFVLVAATTEEVFFRGLLLRASLDLTGRIVPALLISAALFGLVHVNQLLFVPIFVADGCALGAIRIRTGSLVPAVLGHGLLNFLTATLLIGSATVSDQRALLYVALVVVVDLVMVVSCLMLRRSSLELLPQRS